MPVLTIIAGPNGAGKSTHSKELLVDFGIEAFDFDKEFHTMWSEFNFDPYIGKGVMERAQKAYADRRNTALQKKQSFAVETTYDGASSTAELFRSSRYHLELIFICLESAEMAIERVKDRVAKGGHYVEEAMIRERFDKGLERLDATFHEFDLVSMYLSKPGTMAGIAVLEPLKKTAISFSSIPASSLARLPKLTAFIGDNT